MRFLDQQLDDALERAYETLMRRRARLFGLGQYRPELRRLARLQLDGAILFEQVTNALKLVGEQYLARVRSEEHTSELQSLAYLVCRLLLEKKKKKQRCAHDT